MYGRILHITHIDGLKGILESGFILSNPDGSRGYSSLGSQPNCYVCQKLNSTSILDLKNAEKVKLLDNWQNWLGVFTEHKPAIALELIPKLVEDRLKRFSVWEALEIKGRYIVEAEACCPGEIPVGFIERAFVIGCNYRIICNETSLGAAYERAKQVKFYSRRHRKHGLLDFSDYPG